MQATKAATGTETQSFREAGGGTWDGGGGGDVGPELRWAWMTDKRGNRAGKRGSSQVLEPNREFPRGLTEN